ncbi:alpha-ketoacid dehydrogenase subunit alpha/beta [Caballeronia novacaledonica]|uniref:alpha-ketoacid dehydrogenase subunit alpha/beta n=1 Tax=Caballeronia novacaledonica TaxID=1544861 RepID=UPI000417E53F|nr:alpha-ketoacid dehydrogenase subunit alpha/beta [Caballeronia novacaledonica]GJH14543.1 alpha-ketoacid dehydrogenase subunit alpha/beta [Caballeronia novacaledonica]
MEQSNQTKDKVRAIKAEDFDFVREMFQRTAFIRAFEAKALALSKATPPAIVGSMHLCAGQEIVPLASLAALRPDDKVISTYRGHGWALASGLSPLSVMAELCHRAAGVNNGRAGSAFFMAPEQRFIGENSIVGAGVPIACGVAMADVARGNGNVTIVSIGDGAMNQGAVHEALVFAAYRKLPVILVVENNGWSELTPTNQIVSFERLAQRARAYGIPGTTIDGTDPVAVRDTIAIAAERARAGGGPAVVECRVPRLWGHYNRDVEHYRPKSDKADAELRDPLRVISDRLVNSGVLTSADISRIIAEQEAAVEKVAEEALASPVIDTESATAQVVAAASAFNGNAKAKAPVEMTYIAAVNEALRAELQSDKRTLLYGEDVGKSGGIFGAAKNLHRDFGDERVFDTPISESAILGSAVGAAVNGMKPIVEIMWADFMLVALDQMVNQAANIRYITGGKSSAPMVMRTQQGATPGSCAQHSQCLEALLAHVPGLKVCLPATPQDAYDLLRQASADADPCVVIEARGLYPTKGQVAIDGPVAPVGTAKLHRTGDDIALITWGAMLHQALAAAEQLSKDDGIEASVLDLRWLNPLDENAIRDVVRACAGRVLIVHEAVKTGGFGAEILAKVTELCGDLPKLDVQRLATPDVRIPAAPHLQAVLLPNAASIVSKAQAIAAAPKKAAA